MHSRKNLWKKTPRQLYPYLLVKEPRFLFTKFSLEKKSGFSRLSSPAFQPLLAESKTWQSKAVFLKLLCHTLF